MDRLRPGPEPLLGRPRDRQPQHLPQLWGAVQREEVDQGDGRPEGDLGGLRGRQH